ncbi:MAG TPA: polysaccharide deacetylase family protein [Chloroflexia bacterium]|nr:polysaccharide deacetylase family protein [Chloroflexia bacterium]
MLTDFTTQYLPPLLLACIVILAAALLLYGLARRSESVARRVWNLAVKYRGTLVFLFAVTLFLVAFSTFLVRHGQSESLRKWQDSQVTTASNLLVSYPPNAEPGSPNLSATWSYTGNVGFNDPYDVDLASGAYIHSHDILVRPGATYRYSFYAFSDDSTQTSNAQVRLLWLGADLGDLAWNDSPSIGTNYALSGVQGKNWPPGAFVSGSGIAPPRAKALRFELTALGPGSLKLRSLSLVQDGVYVEAHPNATSGSLAFSFDWESAMGGPVHSQGMTGHDVAGAEAHGILMRQGADWLNDLFVTNHISATFYATGYNLLDGNTGHLTFSGDPTYTWAKPKNNWHTDWWLTHPWYSDDPFGTYQSDPAWYFGDQTASLLAAGHEIAPHTFAHIYVRGSNPTELATDMDEWRKYGKLAGAPPPTTFSFPWRSSNSLTADFYDVLYKRGIRAVIRVYAPDLRDLYTIGAASVYTQIAVMPDFMLGSAAAGGGEETGGGILNEAQGMDVIQQTLARHGTTSFWQHPEQLGNDPDLADVRTAWQAVVQDAALARNNGVLWINTIANITAYQRDVTNVTASLQRSGGGWQILVRNDSATTLQGVTLTLPGDASTAHDEQSTVQSVSHPAPDSTTLSEPGRFAGPSRQIVLATLPPGMTTIDMQWAPGQEPQQ